MKDFYEWEKNIVSTLSGKGVSLTEGTVQEVFEMISRILIDQGEVSLEAIGSFRKREEDGRVTFIPSRTIRRQLEESQHSVSLLQQEVEPHYSDESSETSATDCPPAQTPPEESNEPHTSHLSNEMPVMDLPEETPSVRIVHEKTNHVINEQSKQDTDWMDKSKKKSASRMLRILLWGGAIVSLVFLVFVLYSKLGSRYKIKKNSEIEVVAPFVVNTTDAVSAGQTAGQDASENTPKVEGVTGGGGTEIIKKGDNLPDLSRKHYGRSCFWVYIFLENRDELKSPLHLSDGTSLRIPRLEDSGIITSDSACIAAALNLAIELLEGKPGNRH